MKVFVSSLISGFEPFRDACKGAIATLRHEPVMAEDFGARASAPQIACLQGLRNSDVMLLVLGARYGALQASNLSATHEEYRDAQGRKPVIAFVQADISPEPAQAAFIAEVERWEGGVMRGSFTTADDLRDNVIRALHDHTLTALTGQADPAALMQTAASLLPPAERHSSYTPILQLALAGGPAQALLRPAEIEAPALADALHQAALFGETRIFDGRHGVESKIEGSALVVRQQNGNRLQLDEQGHIALRLVLEEEREGRSHTGFLALIEEQVFDRLQAGLGYASWLLDRIDPTQHLMQLAIAARIDASDHMAWLTRRERDASPNSMSLGWGNREKGPITVSKARPALRLNRGRIAEDLLVPLRRQWKNR